MKDELDPAHEQEGVSDDATTVTDPQVTEESAESPEKSEENATREDQKDQGELAPGVELVVEGEEPAPKEPASPVIRDLRKRYREAETRAAEAEKRLKAYEQPDQAADPGPEPTIEDCGFDGKLLSQKLLNWHKATERKQEADRQAATYRQSRLDAYASGQKELPGFAEAEAVVLKTFDIPRQNLILRYAKNPALLVYALGQKPDMARALLSENDIGDFVNKVRDLEATVKIQKKSQVPPPERQVNGTGPKSGAVDSQEKQLRDEARESGDYTKLNKYKQSRRQR